MTILITGATGFLGSRLTEHFSRLKTVSKIIATGRKIQHDNVCEATHVEYKLGDLSNMHFVESLFETPIDVVINCASLSSPWGAYMEFYTANIITQKNLINASIKYQVKRFVYTSTPSIYFNFKDRLMVTEESELPEKMVNAYAETKWHAEKMLEKTDLSYVILRPRALIGRGDTVILPRLIRSYTEGRLKILGNGKNMVDLTPVGNMALATEKAVFAHGAVTRTDYNISNGEPINLWSGINRTLVNIGYEPITKKIPYRMLYALAGVLEWKAHLLKSNKEPVLTRYSVGALAKSFSFNIDKARKNLGYNPIQSVEGALDEYADWYKSSKA